MLKKTIIDKIKDVGPLVTNTHVVYSSKRHGNVYFNKDHVFTYPNLVNLICQFLAETVHHTTDSKIDVVVGPESGGSKLALWVAFHLSRYTKPSYEVRFASAHKKEGTTYMFSRGYDNVVRGKHVLIVDDVLMTGNTVRKIIDKVVAEGGVVVGVVAILNRGNITAEMLGVSFLITLLDLDLPTWSADTCPLCAEEIPINVEIGYGRAFEMEKKALG